jgi:D-alanyl-D-alanine carboxypeptidase/D-alanyl-D-alanine-endopeptidase (penicillin-binding protein 4)
VVIRELLEREGVQITGRSRTGLAPSEARELYVHQSRALYRIIDDLNKFSNNFIAEQVLKTLGAEVYGPPGSWGKGLAVVAEVLESLGIARGTYTLADGSGLSRLNRLSAAQLVTVLIRMAQDFRVQPEYMASLRTPASDGRHSYRFQRWDHAQRARVKTGSLSDVSALAGYVNGPDGEVIAFALLLNGPLCSMERAWEVQDAVVEALMHGGR